MGKKCTLDFCSLDASFNLVLDTSCPLVQICWFIFIPGRCNATVWVQSSAPQIWQSWLENTVLKLRDLLKFCGHALYQIVYIPRHPSTSNLSIITMHALYSLLHQPCHSVLRDSLYLLGFLHCNKHKLHVFIFEVTTDSPASLSLGHYHLSCTHKISASTYSQALFWSLLLIC